MKEAKPKRFVFKNTEQSLFDETVKILVDKETGINYLIVSGALGSGVTPLLGADGEIVISRGDD